MNPPTPTPSLPEELVIAFLARLPNKSRRTASLVCQRWLQLLESRQFYILRKQLGHVNHLACFLQSHPPPLNTTTIRSNPHPIPIPSHVITVFDPISHDCKILPPIPNSTSIQFDHHSEIVSTEGKLILMNQTDPKNLLLGNSIFVFDFSSGHWRQGKNFPIKSKSFAIAATPDGRVFVAGGFNPENFSPCSGWCYDVRKDEWSELPPTNHLEGVSTGVLIGNKFRVSTICPMGFRTSTEIYNLESGEWENLQWKTLNKIPDNPYEFYTRRDGTSGSWKDYCFKSYKLTLGDRCLLVDYQKANLDKIASFGIIEEGKFVGLPLPYLIYGNLYSRCCVEVH